MERGTPAPRGVLRQFRAALLAGTAVSLGLVAYGGQASAACIGPDPDGNVACSGSFPNGIYFPNPAGDEFNLTIGDNPNEATTIGIGTPPDGFGGHGVTVTTLAGDHPDISIITNNDVQINTVGVGGNDGIAVLTNGDNGIVIDNSASIQANRFGISAFSLGGSNIEVINRVDLETNSTSLIAGSESGEVRINNEGNLTSTSGSGISIHQVNIFTAGYNGPSGGDASVTNSGAIEAAQRGIFIHSVGDATVNNSGNINSGWSGIDVRSFNGTADITNSAAIVTQGSYGIRARGRGDVLVDNSDGSINAENGMGIFALSQIGMAEVDTGNITSERSGAIAVGLRGATVNVNGSVQSDGIFGALAASRFGTATVNVNGNIAPLDLEVPISPIAGAVAINGSRGAVVNVGEEYTIQAENLGVGALNFGLRGGAEVNVANGAKITTTDEDFGIGIAAVDLFGYETSDGKEKFGGVNISVGDSVTVNSSTAGIVSLALLTRETNISVGANSEINGGHVGIGSIAVLSHGININVGAGSTITGNNEDFGVGIGALSLRSGDININIGDDNGGATVEGTTVGIAGLARGRGNVNINVGDGSSVTSQGAGIGAAALGKGNVDIKIGKGATVSGEGIGIAAVALGKSSENTVTIDNGGTLTGSGEPFDPVIFALSSGGNTVKNSGKMTGRVTMFSPGGNIFENSGTWNTSGFNLIAGGNDEVHNSGRISTSGFTVFAFGFGDNRFVNTGTLGVDGFTTFFGLPTFENTGGRVYTADGRTDDVMWVKNFKAGNGSTFEFDAALNGPGGPLEKADLLRIFGNVDGSTGVVVHDTLPNTPGTFNPEGIVFAVVHGETKEGDFYMKNGPYDKGLFSYDTFLFADKEGGKDWWVLASRPDQTFFELPSIISAAQSLWHSSTGVWLDRTADLRAAQEVCMSGGLKDEVVCAPGVRPGVWARAFGNWSERSQDHRFSLHNRHFGHEVEYDQDSFGIIGGVDFTPGFLPGYGRGGWLLGVMAGYINSNQDFKRSTTEVDFEGALVGGYATYLNGGFFIDAQVAANIGDVEYSNTAQTLAAKDDTDLTSIGGVIDTGYRFAISPAGAFIEPGATLAYVNSNIDDLRIFGTKVDFEDGDSLRGRLGVRLGLSSLWGGYKVEPFIGASAWYEFLGENDVAVNSEGIILRAEDDVSGWIGEVTGGVNILEISSAGVSGFAKGNYQFGEDDYQSFTGQIGVRFQW